MVLLALAWSCLSFAAEPSQITRYWFLYGGSSVRIFGSRDVRIGGGFGFGYTRPDHSVRMVGSKAETVLEASFLHNYSMKNQKHRSDDRNSVIGLAMERLTWPSHRGMAFYMEAGLGLRWADGVSADQEGPINATPMGSFGFKIRAADGQDWMLAIRYLHSSNAGFIFPDRGENGVYLMIGKTF